MLKIQPPSLWRASDFSQRILIPSWCPRWMTSAKGAHRHVGAPLSPQLATPANNQTIRYRHVGASLSPKLATSVNNQTIRLRFRPWTYLERIATKPSLQKVSWSPQYFSPFTADQIWTSVNRTLVYNWFYPRGCNSRNDIANAKLKIRN